jgi:uncharacterized protein (TIGR02145 family)
MAIFEKEVSCMDKFYLCAIACFLALTACGDSDGGSAERPSEYDYVWNSESAELTYPCNKSRDGAIAYLESKEKVLVCHKEDGEWVWSSDSAAVAKVISSSSRTKSSSSKSKSSSSKGKSSSSKNNSSSSRDDAGNPGEMDDITQYLNPEIQYNEFKDPRDGQVYKTVAIGDQEWFAQNLNYDYRRGAKALNSCYNNSLDSCAKYGRLYTWTVAVDSLGLLSEANVNLDYKYDRVQGICPEGWWIPSWSDYIELADYSRGYTKDYGYHWRDLLSMKDWRFEGRYPYHGTDVLGFSALPSRGLDGNKFYDFEIFLMWLSDRNHVELYGSSGISYPINWKTGLMSVRCMREIDMKNPPKRTVRKIREGNIKDYFNPDVKYGEFKDSRDGQVYKSVKISNHVWMAQNLNYKVDENTPCGGGINYKVESAGDCNLYGRLYPKEVAYKICPKGWHLPNSLEFETLFVESRANGDTTVAALRGAEGWDVNLYETTNNSGFTAIPAGRDVTGRYDSTVFHVETGFEATFWLKDSNSDGDTLGLMTNTITTRSVLAVYRGIPVRASIRCVKD